MFLLYLTLVLYLFYNTDKKMISIFTAIGVAIYIIGMKKTEDK